MRHILLHSSYNGTYWNQAWPQACSALECKNTAVHAELAILYAHPDSTLCQAELQLPKLTLVEDALCMCMAQFIEI